jgi:hypothetical protein
MKDVYTNAAKGVRGEGTKNWRQRETDSGLRKRVISQGDMNSEEPINRV